MEAATPLRLPSVRIFSNAIAADGLVIEDRCAVDLVRTRADAGEDPARVLVGAIEVGARVLDREQAGATVELFRADLEKSTREAEAALAVRAGEMADVFQRRFDEAFGAEHGHVAKSLERLFSDGSSAAVQHQLRRVMQDAGDRVREDIVRQFTSSDGALAGFQRMAASTIKQGAEQQAQQLRDLNAQLAGLRLEVQKLQAEREMAQQVAAEHDRSTAKGRPYEEAVFEAVDAIARAQGDDCDAVGDSRGAGGRKGDVVVAVDGCGGLPRGRIVFEAKHSGRGKKEALAELDAAMAQRDADYGVWVVPAEDKLPARGHQLREVNGDKLFVVFDPEDGSRLALEVAYGLARARVLMARAGAEGLDTGAVRAETERAMTAMEDVRRVKLQLTDATKGIEGARRIVDELAERVRGHLRQIDVLVEQAEAED